MILFEWLAASIMYVLCGVSTYIIRVPFAYRGRVACHTERRCHGSCECKSRSDYAWTITGQVDGQDRSIVIRRLARGESTSSSVWAGIFWPVYLAGYATVIALLWLWEFTIIPIHRRAWRPVENAEKAKALRDRADRAFNDGGST